MQGWIRLHRKIFDSDLWNDVTTFRLFTYLLLKASYQDGIKINSVELKRGQWIRSYRKLAEDLAYKEGRGKKEYSLKTIKKSVYKLVENQMVTIQETKQGTLFTVLNYAKYQDFEAVEEETGNGTGNQGETNGKLTGNKNNNSNNAKNIKNKDSTSLKSKIYDKESIPYQLSLRLLHNIRKNNQNFKEPNLQKWANDMRLMIERDNRTEEQIKYLIDWSQQDYFWKTVILSPVNLRKKFDQLIVKCKEERKKQKDKVKNNGFDFMEIAERSSNE